MFAALLYKEYREHRSIWLALALVGAAVLFGLPSIYEPEARGAEPFYELLGFAAVAIAWTYGLVCGAMMLAGEREGGTQVFLDMLPTSRLPLWLAKCLIGVVLVYLQVALLAVQVLLLGYYPPGHSLALTLSLVAAGMIGFSWGILFSSLARSVLTAIGLAMLCQFVGLPIVSAAVFLAATFVAFVFGFPNSWEVVPMGVTGLLMLGAPLPLSALVYSRVDRTRQTVRVPVLSDMSGWWPAWSAVLWLTWRQLRGVLLGLLIFSLLAGIAIIGKGLVAWPVLTLGMGAFCGVVVFLDEQGGGYRFLGEQRFPLGTIWKLKVGILLIALFVCATVMLVPAGLFHEYSRPGHPSSDWEESLVVRTFGTALLGTTIPIGLFAFLWPIYGFTVGLVCAMVFRKPLVAMVAAFGLGVLLAGAWAPSLILGGLHAWQVVGVPIVLACLARALVHVWASDRLASSTTVCYVGIAGVLCIGLTALGLWYRVAEIPDTPVPADFKRFAASLPTPEENEAGRLIRGACQKLAEIRQNLALEDRVAGGGPNNFGAPGDLVREQPEEREFITRVNDVLVRGWPATDRTLGTRLDKVFAADWWKPLVEASRKPTGVVEDPRNFTVFSQLRAIDPARLAAILLAARGLQLQEAKGDPEVFVDHFAVTLALVRNLQNKAPSVPAAVARAIEAGQLDALTRWLERLDDRPDLLARVADTLRAHENWLPADYHEQYLADYLIALNSLERPEEWLVHSIPIPGSGPVFSEPMVLRFCWRVPFEQVRQERLLRTLHWGDDMEIRFLPRESLRTVPPSFGGRKLEPGHGRRLVRLGAAELKVALRRFQVETGQPAERLQDLVPKYLSGIPEDPFSNWPMRYRLSKGEEIVWPQTEQVFLGGGVPAGAAGAGVPGPPMAAGGPGAAGGAAGLPVRKIPVGQGIVWSVGEDRQDDGARRQGLNSGDEKTRPGEDLIFLVPMPARKKR
jgi:hypothetical protein